MSTNQIVMVDLYAFLSESESRNLSLLYHFGDSSFVPGIANVRDWSKHRFRPRVWSVCMRWNQSDFQQFSWFNLITPTADFLFLTLKSWFYSCMQPANIADIHFYSLCQAPTPQRQKTHTIVFTDQKSHLRLVIGQLLIFHFWKNHPIYQNLCSLLQIIFFFFNLACSIFQYVYSN